VSIRAGVRFSFFHFHDLFDYFDMSPLNTANDWPGPATAAASGRVPSFIQQKWGKSMKNPCFAVLSGFFLACALVRPSDAILKVNGRFLYDGCGEKVVIRGIEDYLENDIDEIAKTGCNAIRLVYNMSGAALDSLLRKACIDNKMLVSFIPAEGYPNTGWWNRPEIRSVVMKYQDYLLLHAYGEGAYVCNDEAAQTRWLNETKPIISALRGYGYKCPLEILSCSWGQQLDILLKYGKELLNFDPEHNLLFGHQMYAYTRPTDSTFAVITGSGLPFLIGSCTYRKPENCALSWYDFTPLDQYQKVWEQCHKNGIGCFYWCWYASCDKLSVDGKYGNWTEAGNYICGTGQYSLSRTSVKSQFLLTGKCTGVGTAPFSGKWLRFLNLQPAAGPAVPLYTLNGRHAGTMRPTAASQGPESRAAMPAAVTVAGNPDGAATLRAGSLRQKQRIR
jgi:mannan endo-1,4-beta-mannosidase